MFSLISSGIILYSSVSLKIFFLPSNISIFIVLSSFLLTLYTKSEHHLLYAVKTMQFFIFIWDLLLFCSSITIYSSLLPHFPAEIPDAFCHYSHLVLQTMKFVIILFSCLSYNSILQPITREIYWLLHLSK